MASQEGLSFTELLECGLVAGQPRNWGTISCRSKRFSHSPYCPDWIMSPPSIMSNEYCGLFVWRYGGRWLEMTAHLHLVPSLRLMEPYHHSLIRVDDVVHN
jgi:hypothetical protein